MDSMTGLHPVGRSSILRSTTLDKACKPVYGLHMVYTKEERREYQAAYRRKRRSETIEYLGGKCVVCGTTENLEFNHKDPTTKSFNLGRFWGKLEDYWAEVDKCELLCKTHHAEETKRQWVAGTVSNRPVSAGTRAAL